MSPNTIDIIVGTIFLWVLGLSPVIFIRYGVVKAPLSKGHAAAISGLVWFGLFLIFLWLWTVAGEAETFSSRSHAGFAVVAIVAYSIMRRSNKGTSGAKLSAESDLPSPTSDPESEMLPDDSMLFPDVDPEPESTKDTSNPVRDTGGASQAPMLDQEANIESQTWKNPINFDLSSFVLGAVVAAILLLIGYITLQPQNYDDCVLKNMQNVRGPDLAAKYIAKACRDKFPLPKKS